MILEIAASMNIIFAIWLIISQMRTCPSTDVQQLLEYLLDFPGESLPLFRHKNKECEFVEAVHKESMRIGGSQAQVFIPLVEQLRIAHDFLIEADRLRHAFSFRVATVLVVSTIGALVIQLMGLIETPPLAWVIGTQILAYMVITIALYLISHKLVRFWFWQDGLSQVGVAWVWSHLDGVDAGIAMDSLLGTSFHQDVRRARRLGKLNFDGTGQLRSLACRLTMQNRFAFDRTLSLYPIMEIIVFVTVCFSQVGSLFIQSL